MAFDIAKRRGYDAVDETEKKILDKKAEREANYKTRRFWLPVDKSATLTFLDDKPPVLEEHELQIDGQWGNHYTCLSVVDQECPLCKAGGFAMPVGFYTVYDHSTYENNQGQTVTAGIRVLAAKLKSLKALKSRSQKYGGLTGLTFDVMRTSSEAAKIGDTWDKSDTPKYDKAGLEALTGKPLAESRVDWNDYLAPKTAAELEKLVQYVQKPTKKGQKTPSNAKPAASTAKSAASAESDFED